MTEKLKPEPPDGSTLRPNRLRCEYLTNPLGIDIQRPRLSWIIESDQRNQIQTAWQIQAARSIGSLNSGNPDLWDSGRVESRETAHIEYAGKPLRSGDWCFWRVRVWLVDAASPPRYPHSESPSDWSQPAHWSLGPLTEADWHGAEWIGSDNPSDVPWLRRNFTLAQKPIRAIAHVASLAYFELYANGRKASDDVLTPAVSDHSRRTLYMTYDVTEDLAAGANCLALWIDEKGWFGRGRSADVQDRPLVRVLLMADMPDGSVARLGSDAEWKARASNIAIIEGGRRHDATHYLPDWNLPSLDDSAWRPAPVFHPAVPKIAAQMCEPNRIMKELPSISCKELAPGEYMIDMGRNYTGWFELRVNAPRGTLIQIDYAEQRYPEDDSITYGQRDEYVARGEAGEVFCNRFNYRAFRRAKATGLKTPPRLEDARGLLIHTAYEDAGEFECSNDLLNRLQKTVAWTYRCVSLGGYMVDCPHRERLGYGGDGQVTMETGLWNFATGAMYTKWLRDWQDAQDPDSGELPNIAPTFGKHVGGGPIWGAISVLLPWALYERLGDRRALAENYPMMRRYMDYLSSISKDGIIHPVGQSVYEFLGDWVAPDRDQEIGEWSSEECRTFFINCFHLYLARLMAKIAPIVGHGKGLIEYEEDAIAYAREAERIRDAVNAKFFDPEKSIYANGEQPYLAFALLADLVPKAHRQAVMDNLEREIVVTRKGHIHAGMHGTWFLFKYLNAIGRDDLIFLMTTQKTYPGWGYMLEQGATTIWERWDGHYSQIHSTLLPVGSWFPEGVAGIQLDDSASGFEHFIVRPGVVGNLTWARASYDSIRGRIEANWRLLEGKGDAKGFELKVTIPANTFATLYIPADAKAELRENGAPAGKAEGIREARWEEGRWVVVVGSGSYVFRT